MKTQIHPDVPAPELKAPDDIVKQLAWFIGDWTVESRMLTDAEKDTWSEETGRAIHTYEMGGHLIFEHVFGPLMGEPFEAWSLRKYNPTAKRWEQRWVDNSANGFYNWIGQCTETGFTGYAHFFVNDDFTLKGEKASREIFENITPQSFDWRLESTSDSGQTWRTTWTLKYIRR